VVPVDDRVEAEGECSLGLPAPEGPQREHHDVPLTERLIERERVIGESLAAGKFS
jgi:hypothetical protein